MTPVVAPIGITTIGIAPAPVLAAVMPGFSALLASAAAVPSVSTATAMPQPSPAGLCGEAPPQPALLPVLQSPAMPVVTDAKGSIPPAPEVSLVQRDVATLVVAAAPMAPTGVSLPTRSEALPTLDRPARTAIAPSDDAPVDTDLPQADLLSSASSSATAIIVSLPAPPQIMVALPSAPAARMGAEIAAAPKPQAVPIAAATSMQLPSRIAPAPTGVSLSAPPISLAADRVDASPLQSGSPVPLPPDAAVMAVQAPAAAVPMAMTRISAEPAAPLAIPPHTVASVAAPSAISLPAAAPRPAAVALAVPSLAPATRPGGGIRLPRALPDADDRTGGLVPAAVADAQRPVNAARSEPPAVSAPRPAAIITSVATDIAVNSDRLGAVRIGIEGAADDLRVSLGLSPAAAVIVAADAPRLLADLAAGGVRLQSLDLAGGGFAGGQGPSQGTPQPRVAAAPLADRAAEPNPAIPVRARTADRYA